MMEASGLMKLGRFSGEDLALSSCWISLAEKLTVYGRMYLVADMAKDVKMEIRSNILVCLFPSCLYLEFYFFVLILKCGGSHILGLGESNVKARCDLLHLVKPALLHLG